jgi:hypothetical protein
MGETGRANKTLILTAMILAVSMTFIDQTISLVLINVIGTLVFALLVPYIAIGRTLLYFDLQAKAAAAPEKRWGERLPGRTAPAGAPG